jgi:hypothetical protein
MKIIAWCYNCQQQISFNNVWRNRNGVAIPVDDYGNLHSCNIKIERLDFKVKDVSDADKAYILIKITGQFREKYIPLDWNSGKRHDCNETPDLEVREYRPSQELMKKM